MKFGKTAAAIWDRSLPPLFERDGAHASSSSLLQYAASRDDQQTFRKRVPASTSKSWTAGRKFGIVVDAGSSGSRIQVYSWLDHDVAKADRLSRGQGIAVLPRIEKGVEDGEAWTLKVEPGISSLADDPSRVDKYLAPLFDHAKSIIPPSQLASTPVYILATAGMRLLPEDESAAILAGACRYVQSKTPFQVHSCEDQIRIISGEEEGIYGWVAINYLMDGFDAHGVADKGKSKHSSTYGFLDMGGASTQIAFEPNEQARKEHADNLLSVNLRLLDGMDVHHPVFVTTWLGYGTNKARDRYVDATVAAHLREHPEDALEEAKVGSERPMTVVHDPCLPKSLLLTESRHAGFALQGTGDFAACLQRSAPLLNREMPCPDTPCLMGVHVPPIDFNVNHFIGISEYWYSTQDIWSLGGVYDFPTFERSAIDYCSQDWETIVKGYSEGGNSIPPGHHIPDVHRLEMQCFKAAWIVNVLHEGIGIPRLTLDKGGEGGSTNKTEEAIVKAGEKGFAKTPSHFQSVNEINNVAVSWTLGRMVLEVTDSIPRSSFAPAHSHHDDADTPIFEWKSAHPISGWRHRFDTTLHKAYNPKNVPFLLVVAIVLLAVFLILRSPKRRRFRNPFSRKPNRDDYGLVSMEEGDRAGRSTLNKQDDPNGDPSPSPRKDSSFLSRTLMPLRVLASRATSAVSRNPPRHHGPPSSFLPVVVSSRSSTPSRSPSSQSIALTARPTANLRHVNSSPSLYRGSPPQRSSTLPSSKSASKLHIDITSSSLGLNSLHALAETPPLTPPARPGSPAWNFRVHSSRSSPKIGTSDRGGGGRFHTASSHRSTVSASSDSDGYLSVPVGVSSTAPNVGNTWTDNTADSSSNFGGGGANFAFNGITTPNTEEVKLGGLRSRNSSHTNLSALARNRSGHARQNSLEVS